MNPLYVGILLVLIGSIRVLIMSLGKEKHRTKEERQKILSDFYDQVNSMLEEGEILEAHCGYDPCAAVTNRRLLIGDEYGIKTIPFSQIQKVKAMNYSGYKTKDPERTGMYEIKADETYVLTKQSEDFVHVVESLNFYTLNV